MNQRLITRVTRLELRNGKPIDWDRYRRFWKECELQAKAYLLPEIRELFRAGITHPSEAAEAKDKELKKICRYRWEAFDDDGDVEKFPLPGDPAYVEGYIDAYPEI